MNETLMWISVAILIGFASIGCRTANGHGTVDPGAAAFDRVDRDQQAAADIVDRGGTGAAAIADGLGQSVGTVEGAAAGLVSATGYSGELARGLGASLDLVDASDRGLAELERILCELAKRAGVTDGLGAEPTVED
ncbi:hypothetical protein FACS1894164_12170 [Spirochaetia bacterium]|nr:hypothetical protein FACS1894164_12170 [Spirochaetia bacterium]